MSNQAGHNMNNDAGLFTGLATLVLGTWNVVSNWSSEQWISFFTLVAFLLFGAGNLWYRHKEHKLKLRRYHDGKVEDHDA